MELRNAVMSRFKVELPAIITFDYPTVSALSSYIASKLALMEGIPGVVTHKRLTAVASALEDQAVSITEIVGISSSVAASGARDKGVHTLSFSRNSLSCSESLGNSASATF